MRSHLSPSSRSRGIAAAALSVLVLVGPGAALGLSSGPPDGTAGDPPLFETCIGCHASFPLNGGQGALAITGLPSAYVPGVVYALTVDLTDPTRNRWGFQLTVVRGGNGLQAGTLVPGNPSLVQVPAGPGASTAIKGLLEMPKHIALNRGASRRGRAASSFQTPGEENPLPSRLTSTFSQLSGMKPALQTIGGLLHQLTPASCTPIVSWALGSAIDEVSDVRTGTITGRAVEICRTSASLAGKALCPPEDDVRIAHSMPGGLSCPGAAHPSSGVGAGIALRGRLRTPFRSSSHRAVRAQPARHRSRGRETPHTLPIRSSTSRVGRRSSAMHPFSLRRAPVAGASKTPVQSGSSIEIRANASKLFAGNVRFLVLFASPFAPREHRVLGS